MDLMRKLILLVVICLAPVLSVVAGEAQVAGLKVFHRSGRTFITFKEIGSPGIGSDIDDAAVRKMVRGLDEKKLHYLIYRSEKRIDSVEGLTSIAEVKALSCWNVDYYGVSAQEGKAGVRYVIEFIILSVAALGVTMQ